MDPSFDSFSAVARCGRESEFSASTICAISAFARFGGGSGAGSVSGGGRGSPPSGGGSGDDARLRKRFPALLDRTATPEKELDLLEDAITGGEDGFSWMEMVRRAAAGEPYYASLMGRPLAKKLFEMTRGVLVPSPDNFTPEERTPWGGTIIPQMKMGLRIWAKGLVVGESWEISGHPRFPNSFAVEYAGKRTTVEVAQLAAMFSRNLYGPLAPSNEITSMPFLVKLLNSGSWSEYIPEFMKILGELDDMPKSGAWRGAVGATSSLQELGGRNYDDIHQGMLALEREIKGDIPQAAELRDLHRRMLAKNLSVQVHPRSGFKGMAPGEHSKTEAWIIVDAEEGAGLYLGLKEGVTKERFAAALNSGDDVTRFLNFVPVCAGDVFFIPAGTIHAIGAGVLLVEPQETSETTYRVFDYGRVDDMGRPRQLHVDQAMAATIWDGPRGPAAVSALRRMPEPVASSGDNVQMAERLFDEPFARGERLRMTRGEVFEGEGGVFRGYTVIEGAVSVVRKSDSTLQGEFRKGQSFMVPAAMGDFAIRGLSGRNVMIETSAAAS
ncbi:MAG: hypothetical protein JXA24_01205 [Proteobacteria bacterium]|nr:hypothetical protein [Pseudomonadota bacterium]